MFAGITTRPGIIGVMTIGLVALVLAGPAFAQKVTKQDIPGIRNFARVETTVACGGATTAEAMPELKKMGFKSIVNLRLASERGANVEEGAAAAEAAGLNYTHIPFNAREPDPGQVTKFLDVIMSNDASPAYIHCAGGPRAAMMWLVKRLVVDGWDTEKAVVEATDLGLTIPQLKDFAIDYASAHMR
jgi:uncharacterized protein (TIGR01244 family)